MYFVLYLILSLILLTKQITMTPGEREQKIIEMMQKICIMSMTGNLFEKKGLQRSTRIISEYLMSYR
jgi:hypothetical protein